MAQSRSTLGILTVLIILSALAGGIWWRLRPPPEEERVGAQPAGEVSEGVAEVVQSVTAQFNAELPQPVTGAVVVRDTLWISVTAKGRAEAFR